MPVRLLVIEGNTIEGRARHRAAGGIVASENYANVLRELANLPDASGLESYDGIAITGSALHIYNNGPEVARQIDLVRSALESGTPAFGSCWGLQLLTVAAGGSVRANPQGRELGIARSIVLTEAGRSHSMFAGKTSVFEAVTIHMDEIEALAPDSTILALNGISGVQAAEIRHGGTVAWGVQYHPEYPLSELAAIVRRTGIKLVDEGFFTDESDLLRYASDLVTLNREPSNKALAWRHGIDGAVLDKDIRVKEIGNWIAHQVMPTRSRRGRG
jgi:GMP synthase (glutamine-hydrolysing)